MVHSKLLKTAKFTYQKTKSDNVKKKMSYFNPFADESKTGRERNDDVNI